MVTKKKTPKPIASGRAKTKPRAKASSAQGKNKPRTRAPKENKFPTGQASSAQGKLIGKVSHYFDKIGVVAMKLAGPLKKGDSIRIEGGETLFSQKVVSLQKEHKKITSAGKGDEVGIKVRQKAREGYRVYKK